MNGFTPINLGDLPAPKVIQQFDFEAMLLEMKAKAVELFPELAVFLDLESEPVTKLLEACCYFRLLDRAEFNDGVRACMLPHATGTDLDNLVAFWGVARLTIQDADDTVSPPIPEIREADDALRERTQLSLEGHTSAGSYGAYLFWTLTASGDVKNASVLNPAPGDVLVTVLSHQDNGTPPVATLNAVSETLNHPDRRQVNDILTIQGPDVVPYHVEASLTLFPGPQAALVLQQAEEALNRYIEARHRLGHDITISGLHAALHQDGVQKVEITSPMSDIVIGETEVAYCASDAIAVSVGGVDV